MAKKKIKKIESPQQVSKHKKLFAETPIWKSLMIMAFPSMIMMLTFGSYYFFDNVLSINMAADSYSHPLPGLNSAAMIRIFMSGYGPINSLMMAFTLLIGIGVSTRVSINMGRGDIDRAKNTLRTGFMVGLIFSFVLAPILIFSARPWIGSQYTAFDSQSRTMIENEAFKYALPIIATYPITMFGQMLPSLLRVEARNKQMLVASMVPIFLNLGLDTLFMGPGGMGVEGGAWATVTANIVSAVILGIFVYRSKEQSILKFSILFGWKFKLISIFGIILVGLSPFLRNMAQSITGSVQNGVLNDVSTKVFTDDYIHNWSSLNHGEQVKTLSYIIGLLKMKAHSGDLASNNLIHMLNENFNGSAPLAEQIVSSGQNSVLDINAMSLNPNKIEFQNIGKLLQSKTLPSFSGNSQDLIAFLFLNPVGIIKMQATSAMISVISGAMPVFVLFFPVMFSFAQAARPIASYNYGAKNYKRVRQIYFWSVLYSTIAAIIIYFLVAWGISGPLIDLLGVKNTLLLPAKDLSIKALKIIMLTMIAFSFAIGGMTIFGSTDRIVMSVISSALQGLILFWPLIYSFKEIALNHLDNNLLLMWFWPVSGAAASLVITIMVIGTLINLNKKDQITLDERIQKIYDWRNNKVKARKTKINSFYKNFKK